MSTSPNGSTPAWCRCREGAFDLDDYIDYVISMLHLLRGDVHVVAVCQPSVPVLAAVARMEADGDPHVPHSMVLMGGPIDTRVNPTVVNTLAERRGIDWFRRNVITKVPFPNPGFMRDVYPGFLQLHGFVSMNLDRHLEAHRNLFQHLVAGDGDSAQKHREFYDEYLAVMDLCAEFYLQTVETVFVRHALPKGEMTHRGVRVDPAKIRRVALMTVEGENDDISGVGQTEAAHRLCVNIPAERKAHWLQPGVGHYGVFNGSRFRAEIAPRIADFVLSNNGAAAGAGKRAPSAQRAPPWSLVSGVPAGTAETIISKRRFSRDSAAHVMVGHGRSFARGISSARPTAAIAARLALSSARASRRRSRSSSTARSISCACAGTGRRAATRCASTPPRARSCSPSRRAAA